MTTDGRDLSHDLQKVHEDLSNRLEEIRAELEARVSGVETVIDEHHELLTAAPPDSAAAPATSPAGGAAPSPLRYPSVEQWVTEHLALVYVRPIGGAFRWCAQWWLHAEAIVRLEALWRSWEAKRVEPLGMESWLREQLDHHLPQLLSATGPFSSCTPERHTDLADLPTKHAPRGWWDPPPADAPPAEPTDDASSAGE